MYCACAPFLRLLPAKAYPKSSNHVAHSWHLDRTLAEPPAERKRVGHLLAAGERASYTGELRALVWLKDACKKYLEGMPTTLEQDLHLLDSWSCVMGSADGTPGQSVESTSSTSCPSPKLQLAVEWRVCQKRWVVPLPCCQARHAPLQDRVATAADYAPDSMSHDAPRVLTQAVHLCEEAINRLASLVPPDLADQILVSAAKCPMLPNAASVSVLLQFL